MKTVQAKHATGMNMSFAQLWGSGPKWTITCGNCSCTFKHRLPMVNYLGIQCPACKAVNIIPVEVN